jgi:hypothetical protein
MVESSGDAGYGLGSVSTAHLADASIVLGIEVRCPSAGLRPVTGDVRSPDRRRYIATNQRKGADMAARQVVDGDRL